MTILKEHISVSVDFFCSKTMISESTISLIAKLGYIGSDFLKVIPFKVDSNTNRVMKCKHYMNKVLPLILLITELCCFVYPVYNYEAKNAEELILVSVFYIAASASILIKFFVIIKEGYIILLLNGMLILNENHCKDLFSLNYIHIKYSKEILYPRLLFATLNLIYLFVTI